MKTRLLFIFFLVFLLLNIVSGLLRSQTSPLLRTKNLNHDEFEKQWKQADSLSGAGMPKSAIEIVNRIYTQSKKEGNKPEFIKAVIYRFKLRSDFEEDILVSTIRDLKQEIRTFPEPGKQILTSILAEVYWKYWQNNAYRFQDRTQILNNIGDSIQTWDLKTLSDSITGAYLLSLQNPVLLQRIPVTEYAEILSFAGNPSGDSAGIAFRPTLYDFLAWQ